MKNNSMIETIRLIDKFEGKRNTVLTLVFTPKDNYSEKINKICKWVSTIKHEYKKKQIQKPLNILRNQKKTIRHFQPNGLIICCGYDKLGKIGYFELKVPPKYTKSLNFEYYYGYKFNTNRIKQLIFYDMIFTDFSKETQINQLEKIETNIKNMNKIVVLGDKVPISLEQNLSKQIYYLSDDEMTMDFIIGIKKSGAQLLLFDMNIVECKDFAKKYGKMISILHFPTDIIL